MPAPDAKISKRSRQRSPSGLQTCRSTSIGAIPRGTACGKPRRGDPSRDQDDCRRSPRRWVAQNAPEFDVCNPFVDRTILETKSTTRTKQEPTL